MPRPAPHTSRIDALQNVEPVTGLVISPLAPRPGGFMQPIHDIPLGNLFNIRITWQRRRPKLLPVVRRDRGYIRQKPRFHATGPSETPAHPAIPSTVVPALAGEPSRSCPPSPDPVAQSLEEKPKRFPACGLRPALRPAAFNEHADAHQRVPPSCPLVQSCPRLYS
jgi:hypothetical protein